MERQEIRQSKQKQKEREKRLQRQTPLEEDDSDFEGEKEDSDTGSEVEEMSNGQSYTSEESAVSSKSGNILLFLSTRYLIVRKFRYRGFSRR